MRNRFTTKHNNECFAAVGVYIRDRMAKLINQLGAALFHNNPLN
ncbi:Uncharacterised protein [Providencia rettgeri]|nr:Uncharacterised protein [Providencia rettgeri]